MDFSSLLAGSLSPDQRIRDQATEALAHARETNLAEYLELLFGELSNALQQTDLRKAAGVAIKNALTFKEPEKQAECVQKWGLLDVSVRKRLTDQALVALHGQDAAIGTNVAQAVSSIVRIEFLNNPWTELVPMLVKNIMDISSSILLKKIALETVGFVCESIDPQALVRRANELLTAIVNGVQKGEDEQVRVAALTALLNSLEFIGGNFEHVNERNIIMQSICEATQSKSLAVAVAAFECLVGIMRLYYDYMDGYMGRGLFQMTVEFMNHPHEDVALQAIEFWSTLCDLEIDRQIMLEEGEQTIFYGFSKAASPSMVRVLLFLLTRQSDEDDEWNVAKAAGTCLELLVTCIQDDILEQSSVVFPFIEENIVSTEWSHREAAVMAFGCLLDGPTPHLLKTYIRQAFPQLVKMMKDSSPTVRDTTAWALGRICKGFGEHLERSTVPELVGTLISGLSDVPKISARCCVCLMNLAVEYGSNEKDFEGGLLSGYFSSIVSELLKTAQRMESDEANLRTCAFEALSQLVLYSSKESRPILTQLAETILVLLETLVTAQNQIVRSEDRNRVFDFQAHYLNVVQSMLKKGLSISADRIMNVLLQTLNSPFKSPQVYENAFLVVAVLVVESQNDFYRYISHFYPFLIQALETHQDYILCSIAIGIVGDLVRTMGHEFSSKCDLVMNLLLEAIQDPQLDRSVKPHILSTFGDIAAGMKDEYSRYLGAVLPILEQACSIQVPRVDYEAIDYINELRNSILEAYSCIVQNLGPGCLETALLPRIDMVIGFIEIISADECTTEHVAKNGIGLLGDLAQTFGKQIKPQLQGAWIMPFLEEYRDGEKYLDMTASTSNWTYRTIAGL